MIDYEVGKLQDCVSLNYISCRDTRVSSVNSVARFIQFVINSKNLYRIVYYPYLVKFQSWSLIFARGTVMSTVESLVNLSGERAV